MAVMSYQTSQVRVCIDESQSREPIGRVYSPVAGSFSFQGIISLINGMNELYDRFQYPQETHELRSFQRRSRNPKKRNDEQGSETTVELQETDQVVSLQDEMGRQATFVICIRYRQNATWQGTIQWIEAKKQQTFRSTLEMIKLMDDAMTAQTGEPFEGWSSLTE